ncbi:protein regulator of cytokinesis 1 [Diachasma alloeum]|uniref:protein regulator of cytokinesis 1 n=1 Tax=Diachasma alloeum TaxID=454923 RepID=UPI00073829BB|nr:protein regulator of cytokinesis 1 [Diachasma alloeum]
MAGNQQGEELIEEIIQGLRETIPEFYKEWEVVGFDADTQKKFENAIVGHHQSLWSEMLSETKQRKSNLLKSIETTTQKLQALSRELQTEVDLDWEDAALLDAERHLRQQLEDLEEIKESRVCHLQDLLSKESEICAVMGSKPVGLESTIPSEDQLQKFEVYISSQEAEMLRLKTVFKEVRLEIVNMMEELGYSPKLDFQRLVLNDHHNFVFSPSNMEKLDKLRDEMLEKLSSAKETAESKRQELLALLVYLGVPQTDYEDFLEKNSGCDAATISLLNKEIKKCKEIRMKNIGKYVEKIREDIRELWDACKFGEEQRSAFKAYHYQNYSEEVLKLHELELEELKRFYQRNEKILELFNQYEEMLQRMAELELKSEDPNRLNNRGGQLLEEEKTRKLITKNLPKAEAKLRELLDEFSAKSEGPFLFDGLTFDEYIQRETERCNTEKENLRLARAKAKDEKKSAKKTPLSASRKNLTTAVSMRGIQTSVKRKLPMDKSPVVTGNKKRLVQSEKARPTLACGSKIRRSGKVARRILSNSFNRDSPRRRKTPKIVVSDASNDTLNVQPYEVFQEHISSRNELRSTLLSDQLLKNARGEGKKMKTPVKTPVKPLRKHLVSSSTPHITPKSGPRRPSRSPRITSTPRLTTAPANGLSHLKL